MASDEALIRQAHAAWIHAVNAGDLAALVELMTDDATFLGPGQPPTRREAFCAGFTEARQHASIHCVSEIEAIEVLGDVATTLCRDTVRVVPLRDGAPTALAGHRLSVYRRAPDGRWRLARDAHTLTPVAG